MVARRRGETVGKSKNNKNMLKILLFIRILILNNKAVFCDAFAGKNLKKVYLTIRFPVLCFAVR